LEALFSWQQTASSRQEAVSLFGRYVAIDCLDDLNYFYDFYGFFDFYDLNGFNDFNDFNVLPLTVILSQKPR
jgi:hypothetical protein